MKHTQEEWIAAMIRTKKRFTDSTHDCVLCKLAASSNNKCKNCICTSEDFRKGLKVYIEDFPCYNLIPHTPPQAEDALWKRRESLSVINEVLIPNLKRMKKTNKFFAQLDKIYSKVCHKCNQRFETVIRNKRLCNLCVKRR